MSLVSNTTIPPLRKEVVDKQGMVSGVWYAFFRKVFDHIRATDNTILNIVQNPFNPTYINSSLANLDTDKLNASKTGGSIGWEDLRAPATAVNPQGIIDAPSYNDTHVGYEFNETTDKRIDIVFQLPHGWKKGTNSRPHVHVRPLGNQSGNVVWQLHTSWSNSFGQQPAFTITNTNMVITNTIGNVILKEYIVSLGNSVPNVLSNESSCVKYKLIRAASTTEDNYANSILLDEFDMHYQHEKAGSPNEYPT